jgi:predicted nucleic acid-binding protein
VKTLPEAVIDTNILIYDTFEDSLHHKEASHILDSLNRWIIPLVVIYEYTWFLKGIKMSATDARDKVLEYVASEKSALVREGLDEIRWAISTLVDEGLSLSRFNDKVVLSVALRRNVPLATFDEKLRRQASNIGVALIPGTFTENHRGENKLPY